ncbi:MAG: hypothetical protein ACK5LT_02310 [Lachnospirales bacterium]
MINISNIPFPASVPIVVFIVLIIYFKINKSNRVKGKMEKYIEREASIDFFHFKELPKEVFLFADKKIFDIEVNFDNKAQEISFKNIKENLRVLSEDTMLRLDKQYTNLEIKEIYGVRNLEAIINGESNLSRYIIQLNSMAELLLKNEEYIYFEAILLEAIRMKSDISKTYILLLDYYKTFNKSKYRKFKLDIENNQVVLNNKYLKKKLLEGEI